MFDSTLCTDTFLKLEQIFSDQEKMPSLNKFDFSLLLGHDEQNEKKQSQLFKLCFVKLSCLFHELKQSSFNGLQQHVHNLQPRRCVNF